MERIKRSRKMGRENKKRKKSFLAEPFKSNPKIKKQD